MGWMAHLVAGYMLAYSLSTGARSFVHETRSAWAEFPAALHASPRISRTRPIVYFDAPPSVRPRRILR